MKLESLLNNMITTTFEYDKSLNTFFKKKKTTFTSSVQEIKELLLITEILYENKIEYKVINASRIEIVSKI